MSISLNLHPRNEWVSVKVFYRGEGEGSCIVIELEDQSGVTNDFALHWGQNGEKFIEMFREAVEEGLKGEGGDIKSGEST